MSSGWSRENPPVELVRARVIRDNCAECRNALLAEALSLGGLPLGGEVVMIPRRWLNTVCPHGRLGLKFELEEGDQGVSSWKAEREKAGEVEQDSPNSRMDAEGYGVSGSRARAVWLSPDAR